MRKSLLTIALVACAALTFWAVAASASSGAHFFHDTSASLSGDQLSVYIDEAGVGNATVDYTITVTGNATYECINGGGNHPKATNKETVSNSTSSGFPESPINGRVQATVMITVTPPGPGDFSCPGGQTLTGPENVSYSPVVVTDTTNNVSVTLSAS